MTWPPPLLLTHPRLPWSVDLTTLGHSAEALAGLPWAAAMDAMDALEDGAIANPDEERQVGHYWLRSPERAPTVGHATAINDMIESVHSFAQAVRDGRERARDGHPFTDVVSVGIGGSALGPILLDEALDGDGLRLHFVDNTDPDGVARVLAGVRARLAHTLVLVISKSGGTRETRNGMLLVREALEAAGLHAPSHLVAVTGDGSRLHQQAEREGWRATFPMWDWVGGRTSVTAAVGLLPAELAGYDTAALLAGAADMDRWTRERDPLHNPAALLAGAWYLTGSGRGDRAMVVLPYSDRLQVFSRFLQQLVMESLGKRLDRHGERVDQGLVVYGNKGSTDQHAYVQQLRDGRDDFFATFIQVLEDGAGSALEVEPGATAGDFLQGFLLGTRRALRERSRPSLVLTVPRVDARVLGGLIALFERAVGLYAELIDINAYHQPGVEAGKLAAADILRLAASVRAALPGTVPDLAARLGAEPVEVYYLLERFVATGRAARDDDTAIATYSTRA